MTMQPPDRPSDSALTKALALIDMAKLATDMGVSYQAVQKWVKKGKVPAERCRKLEKSLDGAITRYDLRPDVFGTAPQADLAEAG